MIGGMSISHWLLLVLETRCSASHEQKELPEKIFHLWVAAFVYFSVYYGGSCAFYEYISSKFSIICLIQQENR